jgi:hypothetical protein
MNRFFGIVFLMMASFAYTAEDPYAKHRINLKPELHPLTQEIIKHGIKRYGMQFFDAKQQDAERKAETYNASNEYGRSWMIPTWRMKIYFYPADKATDEVTGKVYAAVDAVKAADEEKTNDEDEVSGCLSRPYLHGRTLYTIKTDEIIKCSIDMSGYPYMWAKEYSQSNTQ